MRRSVLQEVQAEFAQGAEGGLGGQSSQRLRGRGQPSFTDLQNAEMLDLSKHGELNNEKLVDQIRKGDLP